MKRILQSTLLMLALLFSMVSCTEELDFNQFNDLRIQPTVEGSILYLEAEEGLINLISGVDVFSQDFDFEAFSTDLFAERVLDGSITFVVENTTSKELEITIEFLDEAGTVTDTIEFSIPEAPTALIQREIAYGPAGKSIDNIKTLSTIRVTARNLGDNTSVSNLPNPLIILKSSGKFRLGLK